MLPVIVGVRFCRTLLLAALLWVFPAKAGELESVVQQPEADDFLLVDLSGAKHRLSDYRGSVVLVSFWATWCPECIWEMPSLQALSNRLRSEKFVILAVNVGEERQLIQSFVEKSRITFAVLLDEDLEAYKEWPVLGIPTSYVVDRKGRIAYKVVGAIEWTHSEVFSAITGLINRGYSDNLNPFR